MPRFLKLLALLVPVLVACGGGGGGESPAALTLATPAVSTTSSAALTLEGYRAVRQPATAPSAQDAEQARALAIRLTVPAQIQGDGIVLSVSRDIARLQLLNAAASGDTAKELAAISPPGALSAAAAVLTLPLHRALFVQPGTKLTPNFWTATEQQSARASVDGWLARETQLGGAAEVPLSLFSGSHERRLAIEDRLAVGLSWPAAAATQALFTDEAGQRYLVSAFRISGLLATLSTATYRADALSVGGWAVLKLTPAAGTLAQFGSAQLAAALKGSSEALLQPSAAQLVVGDLVLPPLTMGSSSALNGVGLAGASLVFNAEQANLVAMDAVGGQFASALSTSMQLDLDQAGLRLDGKAWVGFAFNPQNVYANTGYGAVTTGGPFPSAGGPFVVTVNTACFEGTCGLRACPADGPVLRSFFLALLDPRGVLQALTWVQTVGKVADCR